MILNYVGVKLLTNKFSFYVFVVTLYCSIKGVGVVV
jgi:hypothetical protein